MKGVYTRIRSAATHNFYFLFKHLIDNCLERTLNGRRIQLALPTAIIGTIVRNLDKVSVQCYG